MTSDPSLCDSSLKSQVEIEATFFIKKSWDFLSQKSSDEIENCYTKTTKAARQ
jgi:hypothetical protein